jgi:hypothetical protein
MEPSGRNQWQPVAMTRRRKRLKQPKTVAVGCDQLPESFHGKSALPLRKGGSHLLRSARSAKSCEPEGPQDLTRRL